MSIAISNLDPTLVAIIQDKTLERTFHDALFPRLLFRSEAVPEKWAANIGDVQIFTRTGLIPVSITPLTPGSDPTPKTYATEQWRAEARQFGDALDTHMPTSRTTLAPKILRDTNQLGLNAGETLNRLVRDRLYLAYLGGETVNFAAALVGATQVFVASINGFTERVLNGQLLPVSAANPIPVTFSNAEPANTVVAAAPINPLEPTGPGILTLGTALTAVALPLRTGIRATTRSRILRVGGAATIDGIIGTNILTLNVMINAVQQLRANKIPPHADGYYHVHLPSEGVSQMFEDGHWQRLHQSLPDSDVYRDLAIGRAVRANFYENTECPNLENSGTLVDTSGGSGVALSSPEIGAEVQNQAGVAVRRTIVTGGGAMYEKYIDEGEFMTDAGTTGKIGNFQVVNGGVQVMTNRIRYIMRAPLDRLQQIVGQAWSFSGDWPVPSDGLTGSAARYKRAVVIEHA